MADLRVKMPMKIVDPTTDANAAGVDASGNLQVILASNTGVDIGDVDVLTMPATAAENSALPAVVMVVAGDDGVDTRILQMTAGGDLLVELNAAIPTGANVIGSVGLEAGTNNVGDVDIVGGTIASDAPLTTNPVTIGGRASTATPAAVTADGDVVNLWLSRNGAMQVDILSGAGGPQDTDDDIVAGGQSAVLGIGLNYGWDGTQWERLNSDAAGSLDVNVTLALPTGGNVIGNVGLEAGTNNVGDVDIVGGTLASDAPLTTNPVTLGGRASTATPTAVSADGDVVNIWLSREGAMHVINEASTNNIGDVDVLTTPADATDAAAHGASQIGFRAMGSDGTNDQQLAVDAAGQLQVDVLTGGGASVPSGPTVEALTDAAVVAGGTGFLDTAEITEAEKVFQISVAATVPYKFRIGFQENTVRTAQTGWMFGQAGTVSYFTPGHPDFYTHAGTSGGTDTIYVEYFNMDNSETADIHATVEYAT